MVSLPIRASAIAALSLVTLAGSASHAGTTRYYYDPIGRVLGALSTADEERTSQTDAADNPSYLHVFPVYPPSAVDTLSQYGALIADQTLTSGDGRFKLVPQEDGNLVIYQGSTALWSTSTSGHQPGWFTMGGDGNLYFFGPDDSVIWSVNTSAGAGAHLVMQSDGNLVVYQGSVAKWSTGTGGD